MTIESRCSPRNRTASRQQASSSSSSSPPDAPGSGITGADLAADPLPGNFGTETVRAAHARPARGRCCSLA